MKLINKIKLEKHYNIFALKDGIEHHLGVAFSEGIAYIWASGVVYHYDKCVVQVGESKIIYTFHNDGTVEA
jgi:hypothetical protein